MVVYMSLCLRDLEAQAARTMMEAMCVLAVCMTFLTWASLPPKIKKRAHLLVSTHTYIHTYTYTHTRTHTHTHTHTLTHIYTQHTHTQVRAVMEGMWRLCLQAFCVAFLTGLHCFASSMSSYIVKAGQITYVSSECVLRICSRIISSHLHDM